MELVIKHFHELSTEELVEIYKLRVAVFVVEQQCPYQEVDDYDKDAYHVYFRDEEGIQAYLRVLDRGTYYDHVSIGRVISVKRRCGLGTNLVKEGIRVAKEKFHADKIDIMAQTYAREFYEKIGFRQISEEFLDVGIRHIKMELTVSERGTT